MELAIGNRPGFSVREFFERFPDSDACLAHIARTKWDDQTPCPACGKIDWWAPIPGTTKFRHRCGKQFSPMKDTVFYRTNLSLMAWFYALLLFSNSNHGMRSSFVRKQLGLGVRSAHRLCNRIREHMATVARPQQIGGEGLKVYIDEVHLKYLIDYDQSERRGAYVMGFRCGDQVLSGIIGDRSRATLNSAIDKFVRPGSILITDGLGGYRSLSRRGWEHHMVNHTVAFTDFKGNHSGPIENYWSIMRRFLKSYRQVAPHNLWRFLAEIEFYYNHRIGKRSRFEVLTSEFPPVNAETRSLWEQRFDWR